MSFRASDAVFEGFRITREKPVLLLWLGAVFFIANAITLLLAGHHVAEVLELAKQLQAGGEPTQEDMMKFMQPYGMLAMVSLPLSLLASALVFPAVNRAVLAPADSRFGYLRLGRDELRAFVAIVLMSLVAVALMFFVSTLASLGFAAGAAIGALTSLIGMVALVVVLIALFVRFSLVMPITLVEKRIGLRESISMTKGRFWPLLGLWALALILSFGVSLLVNIIAMPFSMISSGGMDLLTGTVTAQSVIGFTGVAIIRALLSAATCLILLAPFAVIYRILKNG